MVQTVLFGGGYITQRLAPSPLRLTGPGNPRCWQAAFREGGKPHQQISASAPMVRASGEEQNVRGATVVA
jgi:hypothetical protein